MIYRIKNKVRDLSHSYKIIESLYKFANTIKVNALKNLSDEKFAKLKYKSNRGLKLNLENPKRFNEKLWWLKLNNRDPLLTKCSDKVAVREYIQEQGLGHILNTVYGVYDTADDIIFDELPDEAYIKANHGSGDNFVWNINKPFDVKEFRKKMNSNLKRNYYLQSREWNYKNIEPKVMVEKVLKDKKLGYLREWRFFCFEGKVKLIYVNIQSAFEDGTKNPYFKRNAYDRNFNLLDIEGKGGNFDPNLVPKPDNFEEMIKYAEILSSPFPHVRVDFYNIENKIYFGEMTFYHGGGNQKITPDEWDYKMGEWIDLNSNKIRLENN